MATEQEQKLFITFLKLKEQILENGHELLESIKVIREGINIHIRYREMLYSICNDVYMDILKDKNINDEGLNTIINEFSSQTEIILLSKKYQLMLANTQEEKTMVINDFLHSIKELIGKGHNKGLIFETLNNMTLDIVRTNRKDLITKTIELTTLLNK